MENKNRKKMWGNWVFRFMLICCFLLILVSATNFIVDPLWTFGHNGWWNKYRSGFNERQQKTNYLPHIINEVEGIVIGSSMSRTVHMENFYNYSCGYLRPDDAAEFIHYAVSEKGCPLAVFIGLDFWNTVRPREFDTAERPLFYIKNAKPKLTDIVSFDSFKWSLKSVMWGLRSLIVNKNDFLFQVNSFADGFPMWFSPKNIDQNTEGNIKIEGVAADHLLEYHANYTTISLERMKETIANIDMKPVFFITPVPQIYLKKIIRVGAYPAYERFIRDTVNLFGSVWNFMYLNSVTVSNQYFYDMNHTNNKGGRAIAQRISGGSDYPADFGILVTKENLEEHIRFLRGNIFDALLADCE